MAMDIEGKARYVEEIFSDSFDLKVPRYQRPYAWTTDEAEELFYDLYRCLENYEVDIEKASEVSLINSEVEKIPEYFLGSIVLVKKENSREADIIDGQQRLITLTILLALLREYLDEPYAGVLTRYIYANGNPLKNIPNRHRLTLRERDCGFFKKYVQEKGGLKLLVEQNEKLLNDSTKNIRKNALSLEESVKPLSPKIRIALAQFVLSRCVIVVVFSRNLESAYRIFSILNDRGLNLSHCDILKSEIICGIELETEQDEYAKKWEEAETSLRRKGFEDLFAHIRMIYRKAKPKDTILKEFRTYVIEKHNTKPKQFVDGILLPYADAYETATKASFESTTKAEDINEILTWLNRIDNFDWIPPAILCIKNIQHDSEAVLKFLTDLERLAATMMVRRVGVTQRVERYGRVLSAMEDGRNLFSEDSPLQLTAEEIKQTIETLNGPIYRMPNVPRYVLLKLDSALAGKGAKYDYRVVSIEHVLPKIPAKGSQWLRNFPDEEQREKLTHIIGNLILLSRRKNSYAWNYDFDKKKGMYFIRKGDGISPFVLTTQVIQETTWTPEVVERRQTELINRLETIWRLN